MAAAFRDSIDPDVAIGPVEAFWRFRHRTLPAVALVTVVTALGAVWTGGDAAAVTAIHLTDPRGVPMFRDGTTAATDLGAYAVQRAEFATSDTVLRATALAIGEPLEVVRGAVTATAAAGSRIALECRNSDPDRALDICTALADVYVELSRADTTRRADLALASLRATRQALIDERLARQPDASPTSGAIEQIEVQIAQTALKAALFDAGVEFVDAPLLAATAPVRTALRYGLAGLALGALTAGAVAWVGARRRPMIDDPELAAGVLGAPLLGRTGDLGTSFELAATDLTAAGHHGVLVVTAAWPERDDEPLDPGGAMGGATGVPGGATSVVVGLAEAWARDGRSVVVIDARSDHPLLSRHLGAPSTGLTEVLSGMAGVDEVVTRVAPPTNDPRSAPRFHLIGSGRTVDHMASLLRAPRAREMLERLRNTYESVVIEGPSVLDSAEGAVLAGMSDGVVVVVGDEVAARRAMAVRQRLEVLRVPLVGVVSGADGSRTREVAIR